MCWIRGCAFSHDGDASVNTGQNLRPLIFYQPTKRLTHPRVMAGLEPIGIRLRAWPEDLRAHARRPFEPISVVRPILGSSPGMMAGGVPAQSFHGLHGREPQYRRAACPVGPPCFHNRYRTQPRSRRVAEVTPHGNPDRSRRRYTFPGLLFTADRHPLPLLRISCHTLSSTAS